MRRDLTLLLAVAGLSLLFLMRTQNIFRGTSESSFIGEDGQQQKVVYGVKFTTMNNKKCLPSWKEEVSTSTDKTAFKTTHDSFQIQTWHACTNKHVAFEPPYCAVEIDDAGFATLTELCKKSSPCNLKTAFANRPRKTTLTC